MTTRGGNRAWQALSDECAPEPDDGFDTLPRMVQKAIARGDITLEEALELAATDQDAELCPACGCRPIATARGLCRACHDRRLVEGLYEKLAEIDSHREHDVAKQRVHRRRVELGLPLPRSDRTYPTSDAPVHRECPTCGTLVPDHGASGPCVECELRAERRAQLVGDGRATMI